MPSTVLINVFLGVWLVPCSSALGQQLGGGHALVFWVPGWQVAFLPSRAALCLLWGESRARAVSGLAPRGGCGCHSPLSCWVVAATLVL